MRYFKAFHPGMICNGKRYAENTVYEENGNTICEEGVMHFCKTPFDCLDYYPLVGNDGRVTEFAEVEPLDRVLEEKNKRACRKLRIGAKLSLKDFINAQVDIQMEKGACDTAASGKWSKLAASGDGSQLAASGKWSKLAASGDESQLAASGDWSQLAASGDGSKLAASGNGSNLAASGNWSQLAASGDESQLAASGDWSQLAASGDRSKLAALGNGSRIAASGAHSIAAAIGRCSRASASLGSWIVLAEYNGNNEPICVKAAQIDGEKLKPNVFYQLKGGEFVEASE